MKSRYAFLFLVCLLPHCLWAQFKLNIGDDSPIRKLTIAEMAVQNLYVDSVDEAKLVEDGKTDAR